jgi:serine/threonine-protein kinase HipA
VKLLNVLYHGFAADRPVRMGRLAWHDRLAWFEFSPEFLQHNFNPSPLSLDLATTLQKAPQEPFDGLHGLFSDSLPDGWGLYLMDKAFGRTGRDPAMVTVESCEKSQVIDAKDGCAAIVTVLSKTL